MVNVKRPRLGGEAVDSARKSGRLQRPLCLAGENPALSGLPTTAADRSRRRRGSATEQTLEEGRAGGAAAIAGEAHARGQRRLAAAAIARLRMRNDVLHVAAMRRLQHRDHAGVAAVDVLAEFQL